MNTYANAGEGLRKMFVSMVGIIICVIISRIPYIGVVGSIGIIVCEIVSLVWYKTVQNSLVRMYRYMEIVLGFDVFCQTL